MHPNLPLGSLRREPRWIVSMDSKRGSKANLKKYTKVDGKWRFVPVLKQNGIPYPGTVMIDGKVFPTPPHPKRPEYGGQRPDAHHLELCKQIAWRAKLNCRHCTTTRGDARRAHTATVGLCTSGDTLSPLSGLHIADNQKKQIQREWHPTSPECTENDEFGTDSSSVPPLALGWPCSVIGLALRKDAAAEGRRRNTRRSRSRQRTHRTLAICSPLH